MLGGVRGLELRRGHAFQVEVAQAGLQGELDPGLLARGAPLVTDGELFTLVVYAQLVLENAVYKSQVPTVKLLLQEVGLNVNMSLNDAPGKTVCLFSTHYKKFCQNN